MYIHAGMNIVLTFDISIKTCHKQLLSYIAICFPQRYTGLQHLHSLLKMLVYSGHAGRRNLYTSLEADQGATLLYFDPVHALWSLVSLVPRLP